MKTLNYFLTVARVPCCISSKGGLNKSSNFIKCADAGVFDEEPFFNIISCCPINSHNISSLCYK